jgi:hypothetical protein
MAANPLNVRKRIISKSFHRILDTYNRQTFTGNQGWCLRGFTVVMVHHYQHWPHQAPVIDTELASCIGLEAAAVYVVMRDASSVPPLGHSRWEQTQETSMCLCVCCLQVPLRLCVTT